MLSDAESVRTLTRARDGSSSLLWLRDRDSAASFISYQTDTFSRLSMVFGFDDSVLGSKPYCAAVMAMWKSLGERRRDGASRVPPPRPPPVSMLLEGQLGQASSVDKAKTLLLIVNYDFAAE